MALFRMFEPQPEQLAGSQAIVSTLLCAPQILQVNEITRLQSTTNNKMPNLSPTRRSGCGAFSAPLRSHHELVQVNVVIGRLAVLLLKDVNLDGVLPRTQAAQLCLLLPADIRSIKIDPRLFLPVNQHLCDASIERAGVPILDAAAIEGKPRHVFRAV